MLKKTLNLLMITTSINFAFAADSNFAAIENRLQTIEETYNSAWQTLDTEALEKLLPSFAAAYSLDYTYDLTREFKSALEYARTLSVGSIIESFYMSLHPLSGRLYPFEKNFYNLTKPLSSHVYQWAVVAVRRADRLNENCFLEENTFLGLTDAFRHVYWSAVLSQKFSPQVALAYTTVHEIQVQQGQARIDAKNVANRMDLINNLLGIHFGQVFKTLSVSELEDRILTEMRAGQFLYIKKNRLRPTELDLAQCNP